MKLEIEGKPWRGNSPPRRVLAIRLQALGDTIITLPYLLDLKRQYPDLALHFLTRHEVGAVPLALTLFDKVMRIGGGRRSGPQFLLALLLLPHLWWQRYDAVIDLQNHRWSRWLRQLLHPRAWVAFDRFSPVSAGERTRQTIEALWSWNIAANTQLPLRADPERADRLLNAHGRRAGHELIVLNPAGYGSSRSWPIENYCEFARQWRALRNPRTQFVLLLLPSLRDRADAIASQLEGHCINLTGHADQVDAFGVLARCSLVLTEDSGLAHMAWVQRVPTLALFSSSRKDWSAPQGEWSDCLDSSDLDCGPCGQPVCKYGDNRCLTRYTPALVVARAGALIDSLAAKSGAAAARYAP